MNFIYSILFFAISSLISLFISNKLEGESSTTFFVIGCILGIVVFVFTAVCLFQNMEMKESQKSDISSIRSYKKNISLQKSLMETYKKEVESFLTKLYPDYEKEMFKSIAPSDAETLSMFMVKYPELKFNGVLQSFTDKLTAMLVKINEADRELEEVYRRIRTRNNSSWFFMRVPVPAEVTNEEEK